MYYRVGTVTEAEKESLAEIRMIAMKESLEAIGKFDSATVKNRFLETFVKEATRKVLLNGELVGFYVLFEREDHFYLNHLYLLPKVQGGGIGASILSAIKDRAKENNLPIRLRALRDSRSNDFYKRHGFRQTHEDEWDIYYEYKHSQESRGQNQGVRTLDSPVHSYVVLSKDS